MATKREREQRAARTSNAKAWADKQDKGFESSSIALPDGVEFLQLKKAGKYIIDILPYRVGKGNPNSDEGNTHFERTYYVHHGIGPESKSYLCAAKTVGKRCPICEELKQGNYDQEERDQVKAKMRMLWPVYDYADKTIKILDTAYYKSFGEMLKDKVQADDDTYGSFDNLTRDAGGMTLILKVDDATFNGRSFRQVKNIEMVPKKTDHPESIIDEIPCLDDMLILKSYDELKSIFLQENEEDEDDDKPVRGKSHQDDDDDDSEEEESPKKLPSKNVGGGKTNKKNSSTTDDEDEDSDEDSKNKTAKEFGIKVGMTVKYKKFGECEVIKISPDGTSLLLKDEDDELHKGVGPEEVQIVDNGDDEEDEEEEEVKKPARGKPAAKKVVEEEEDEEDEEEEDEDDDADADDDWDEDEEEVKKPARGKKK